MVFTLVKPHMKGREPKRFYRPIRDGRLYLHHSPALRTGLLSFGSLRDRLLQFSQPRGCGAVLSNERHRAGP